MVDPTASTKRRRDYWEMEVESAQARSPVPPLVAEVDRRVVGFIMGDASGWEYGVPETVGWIDTIGVNPEYQHHGVARALMDELVAHMKKSA